ncbi:MAG: DUF262 domain-containing protein [Spirochaetes bacterium]|uniref:DUF262 domain-containing protein n=1 Tax=Candidatus Gallitreponema excrementavium TaxID=2840840 RepID=A0A9D9HNQ2_9SPIR|nr:DUF262 domain-containing protein [Candidatus Gallitreponema excrementavium]
MSNQQENTIKETAVGELLGMNFFIPGYQRGYRWTEQQVNDLLNDINEFKPETNSWYCLQPLVVKELKEDTFKRIKEEAASLEEVKNLLKGRWEVIDGQQRLTTIYLILACLGITKKYTIEYETRKGSKEFLENISKESKSEKAEAEAQSNIDFFYMHKAYKTVEKFFDEKKNQEHFQEGFKDKLLNNVKFIWYEIDEEENPVTVFTRLNMGKIPLTNAELIKALFLNRSNFGTGEEKNETLRLRQQEIASEWDAIEYTLQNDEFWLFLNQPGDKRPTRIDFIFDLICEQDALEVGKENTGTDEYRTFRYFYNYFKTENPDIGFCWKTVKKYFQIFQEWYNDLELYHYVGYLIEQGEKIQSLIDTWENRDNKTPITKNEFKSTVIEKIKDKLESCLDLDKQYEINKDTAKTKCRPLLLLHNIQTVINQNKQMENSKYGMATFYKFPFHLFKLEKWDVEHINSNTTNPETDEETQKEWLVNIYLSADGKLQDKISKFFDTEDEGEKNSLFNDIKEGFHSEKEWSVEEKNRIWNYTLLDSSTNRSYGNAIFSSKRRIIIGKDRGKWIRIPKLKDGKLEIPKAEDEDAPSAFVPPVTKHIFLKYYSSTVGDNNYWTKEDATAYKKNILDTLKEFGVTDSSSNKNNK